MQGRDFYDRVGEHPELEWLGARPKFQESGAPGGEVLIRHTKTDLKYALSLAGVLEHSWEELEGVLTGRRKARLMTHLTRIVGYFSRVQNWNRSKLAELRDRHKGEYVLPEGAAAAREPVRGQKQAAVA